MLITIGYDPAYFSGAVTVTTLLIRFRVLALFNFLEVALFLPFRFVMKKQSSIFQVFAVKLRRCEEKVVITGFQSTIDDLKGDQKRSGSSSLRWEP